MCQGESLEEKPNMFITWVRVPTHPEKMTPAKLRHPWCWDKTTQQTRNHLEPQKRLGRGICLFQGKSSYHFQDPKLDPTFSPKSIYYKTPTWQGVQTLKTAMENPQVQWGMRHNIFNSWSIFVIKFTKKCRFFRCLTRIEANKAASD